MPEFTRESLAELYFYWRNNYLTVEKFAEHHGLYREEAADLLDIAKRCATNSHPEA